MGEKKLQRELLHYEELRAEIIDWSWDTVKRRIKDSGFPGINIGTGGKPEWVFPRTEVILYFKKRGIQIK